MFTDNNLLYAVVLVILDLITNARVAKIEHVNFNLPTLSQKYYDGNKVPRLPELAIFFQSSFVKKLTLYLYRNSLLLNYMNVWVQL